MMDKAQMDAAIRKALASKHWPAHAVISTNDDRAIFIAGMRAAAEIAKRVDDFDPRGVAAYITEQADALGRP